MVLRSSPIFIFAQMYLRVGEFVEQEEIGILSSPPPTCPLAIQIVLGLGLFCVRLVVVLKSYFFCCVLVCFEFIGFLPCYYTKTSQV